jgi:hypothetical protein
VSEQTLRRAGDAQGALAATLKAGLAAADAEAALGVVTACVVDLLGDKTAHLRPGGLRHGERQYAVSAALMLSADGSENIYLAQRNFPPAQHHLRIASDIGHPGAVVASGQALLLANTDDHADFVQLLSTSRMGSSLYAPFHWRGEMLGQLICGAQARHTYRPIDLEVLSAFADIACALWMAHQGPAQLPEIAAVEG